jgi:hypothetical protein
MPQRREHDGGRVGYECDGNPFFDGQRCDGYRWWRV